MTTIAAAAGLVLGALNGARVAAAADSYPQRPITLIVPFPAGGGVDAVGACASMREPAISRQARIGTLCFMFIRTF